MSDLIIQGDMLFASLEKVSFQIANGEKRFLNARIAQGHYQNQKSFAITIQTPKKLENEIMKSTKPYRGQEILDLYSLVAFYYEGDLELTGKQMHCGIRLERIDDLDWQVTGEIDLRADIKRRHNISLTEGQNSIPMMHFNF